MNQHSRKKTYFEALESRKVQATAILKKFDKYLKVENHPFNIQLARIGFPVYTEENFPVRIIDINDNPDVAYPIVGMYECPEGEKIGIWDKRGYNLKGLKSPLDLKIGNVKEEHKILLIKYINILNDLMPKMLKRKKK